MTEFALFRNGVFEEFRHYDTKPVDIPHKLVTWKSVARTPAPAATVTQDPSPQWALVNDVWTQTWVMVDVSPAEAALRLANAEDVEFTNTIKADTFVQNFIKMTPAQVENYINNNTANLAQVRSLLVKMAVMLLILARNQYR